MKNLFIISLLLVGTLSFSQEKKKTVKPKDTDKEVNLSLAALSKKYNKKVLVVSTYIVDDTLKRYIGYYLDEELCQELIEVKAIKK